MGEMKVNDIGTRQTAYFNCSQSGFIWVRFLKQGKGFDISPGKSRVDE
jgi:hypothetical protein